MPKSVPELESVIDYINKNYRLKSEARFFDTVKQGMLSKNYIISAGNNKYFLKRYRFDNAVRIADIHRVKAYFSQEGIPVIMPIENNNGATYFKCNESYYALFPYIDAKMIKRGEHTTASIISTAQMQAQIHLAGKKSSIPKIHQKQKSIDDVVAKFDRQYNQIESALQKNNDKSEISKIARKLFAKKGQDRKSLQGQLKAIHIVSDHLIHGDYHDQNIFYTSLDSVKYIFDFELCKMASRIFELIRAIDMICFHDDLDMRALRQARQYLSSYSDIYPLSRQEFMDNLDYYNLKLRLSLWIFEEKYLKQNDRVDNLFIKSEALNHENYLSSKKELILNKLFNN